MRRRASVTALLLALLALVGCGSEAPPVEIDKSFRVRQTLETFLDLCAQGEGLPASEILNEPARDVFLEAPSAETGCDRILQLTPLGDDVEDSEITRSQARDLFRKATIVDLEIRGGLAEAILRAKDEESTVELEDTGERWLVTNASLPIP